MVDLFIKGPANIQLGLVLAIGIILIFWAGFTAANKLINVANKAAFGSTDTHKQLDNWACNSVPFRDFVDQRVLHKLANQEQEKIYRDKEIRDLIVGLSDRVTIGFKVLNEKVDPLNDATVRHGVEILALKERIDDMKNGKHLS